MAANNNPIFPNVLRSAAVAFTSTDGTTAKSIYAGATNGARIDSIMITNTDTAAYTFQLFLNISATSYLIGSANIPASAGNTSAVQPVNLLPAIGAASGGPSPFVTDPYGNLVLYLGASVALYGGVTGAITAAKTMAVSVYGGEY